MPLPQNHALHSLAINKTLTDGMQELVEQGMLPFSPSFSGRLSTTVHVGNLYWTPAWSWFYHSAQQHLGPLIPLREQKITLLEAQITEIDKPVSKRLLDLCDYSQALSDLWARARRSTDYSDPAVPLIQCAITADLRRVMAELNK